MFHIVWMSDYSLYIRSHRPGRTQSDRVLFLLTKSLRFINYCESVSGTDFCQEDLRHSAPT